MVSFSYAVILTVRFRWKGRSLLDRLLRLTIGTSKLLLLTVAGLLLTIAGDWRLLLWWRSWSRAEIRKVDKGPWIKAYFMQSLR